MGYENDPYRDETAFHQCTLMRISNQIGRKLKQHLLDFGGNYGGDEDNKAGWMKERWKEEHRERRSVEKGETIAGDSEAEEREDKGEINELSKIGKGKKKTQMSAEELNQLGKPTINKLKKLSQLKRSGLGKAEEGEEKINELFRVFSKKWKNGSRAARIAFDVEKVMAELELAAEDDAHLNWLGKPAVNKLKKLSHLTDILAKKQLHHEFLDHEVLSLLKNWLEPLPDGSLPNINVRAAILNILDDLPIDLKQRDRREQLQRSGLGKVVMLLSKSDEETAANRKLAKKLADKWGLEDWKVVDEERISRRPPVQKVATKGVGMSSRDDQLVSAKYSQGQNLVSRVLASMLQGPNQCPWTL